MNTDLQKVHKSKCAFSGLEGAIKYIGGVIIEREKFNYEIN